MIDRNHQLIRDKAIADAGANRYIFVVQPNGKLPAKEARLIDGVLVDVPLAPTRVRIWQAMRAAGMTWPQIAAACGLKSHSSVQEMVQKFERASRKAAAELSPT